MMTMNAETAKTAADGRTPSSMVALARPGATTMSRRRWPRCIRPMWPSSSTCSSGPRSSGALSPARAGHRPQSLEPGLAARPRGDCPGLVGRPPAADSCRSWTRTTPPICWARSRRNVRRVILAGLPGPLSARIQQLLRYPADTAGGLMQSEYAAVLEGATVEEAVEIVRSLAEAVSNIHNVFVVDHRFHLLGVLPLARLILARTGRDGRCGDGSPGGLRHGGHGPGGSGAALPEIRPPLPAGHRSARRPARPDHGR